MLHPSYKELIDKMNSEATPENPDIQDIQSRYTLVLAAAKRARQINSGSRPLVEEEPKAKNLSVAVDELYSGMVHVLNEQEETGLGDAEIQEEDRETE